MNPYEGPSAEEGDALPQVRTGWPSIRSFSICLVFMAMAGILHFIVRQYFPPDIDRTKWLAAFALLVLRNGLVHHG